MARDRRHVACPHPKPHSGVKESTEGPYDSGLASAMVAWKDPLSSWPCRPRGQWEYCHCPRFDISIAMQRIYQLTGYQHIAGKGSPEVRFLPGPFSLILYHPTYSPLSAVRRTEWGGGYEDLGDSAGILGISGRSSLFQQSKLCIGDR